MTISKDEVERIRLMSELKYELDTQSRIGYAEREARKEGRKEQDWEIAEDTGLDLESIRNL